MITETVEQRKARIRETRKLRKQNALNDKIYPRRTLQTMFLIGLVCAAFFCVGLACIYLLLPEAF